MRAAPAADHAGRSDGARFQAGSELREARERLGWDLGEVAAALRIKLAYLQAIEDGRISALPGNAYALGFLRTYATTLGLDPDEVARRFRAEAHDVNRKTELAFPAPVPERGVPTGAMVLLGLVIAFVGYGVWYRLSDHEQTATHVVPPVPEQLLAAPKAAPVSPQVASVMPPPGAAPPPTPAANTTAPPAPAPASPAPAAPAAVQAQVPSTPTSTPAPVPPAPAQAPVQTGPVQTGPVQTGPVQTGPVQTGLVLHASAVTWVQVRAPDHVLWDHIMQPGDTWPVPADQAGLTLTTGNAGGLDILDNGASLGTVGRTGAVRHNIALTEDGVKAALAANPPPVGTAPKPPPPVHHQIIPPALPDSAADQLNARQLERPH